MPGSLSFVPSMLELGDLTFPVERFDVNLTGPPDMSTAVINVVVDSITLVLLAVFAVTMTVQYFGKRAYRLGHALLCFKTPDEWIRKELELHGTRQEWRIAQERHLWVNIILNSCMVFIGVRLFHEFLTLMFHLLHLIAISTDNDTWNQIAANFIRYPRRFFEAIVMWHYFANFCLLIPIWYRTAVVWVSSGKKSTKRRILSIFVYTYVFLTNVAIAVIFVPLAAIGIAGSIRPDLHDSIDEARRLIIKVLCIPLEVMVLVGVTLFTIIFCTLTIMMVRNSLYLRMKNTKQVQQQVNAIVRLSVGMVFFSACVAVRLLGYALYSLFYHMPDYVTYPLMKAIPDTLFLLTINIVFWPFRIPFIGAPIAIAQEFSSELKNLASGLRKQKKNLEEPFVRSQSFQMAKNNGSSNRSDTNVNDLDMDNPIDSP